MLKNLKKLCFASLIVIFLFPAISFANTVNVYVDATDDLWLAGMPTGTVAVRASGDSVPTSSPLQITGLAVYGGAVFTFSASGTATQVGSIDPGNPYNAGPDGLTTSYAQHETSSSSRGPENGISNIEAPFSSLIGVFLSNSQPSASAAPAMLNYNSSVSGYNTSKDAATYSPLLQQVFFIGDGKTGSTVQSFIAPADATRLFIGVMDTYEWSNNAGGFKVAVSSVPVPGALWLLGSGLIGLVGYRRKFKQ